MNLEIISDTTRKRVALEIINQEIDALNFTKRYYNQGKNDDEIIECVKRDMKHHHPKILNVMLGNNIRAIEDYLNTDGVSIDFLISDLIKDRGYLQNDLRPIKTRKNRLFTPERVVTKPLSIPFKENSPFNEIRESKTFRLAQGWIGKGLTIEWNYMGVKTSYKHDELYGLCWKWLYEDKRADSFPKHGHYSTYHIPQSLLKVPGVSDLIKREQILAA